MALNFPASPANGATHDDTSNGIRYIYNSTKNQWTALAEFTTGAIGAQKLDDLQTNFQGTNKVFTLTVDGSTVKPHDSRSITVYLNNVIQKAETDYTVNSGTGQITFTSAPAATDTFYGIVLARLPLSVDQLPLTGGTMTGDINFSTTQVIPHDQIQSATTGRFGVTKLNDATDSTSTTLAATSKAVKDTKDVADAALPKAGGTMTGDITFNSTQQFDGRDVSADGTKLDGIATSANNYSISSDLLDEDNMASDSATKVASQQSIKAYVDANTGTTNLSYTASSRELASSTGTNVTLPEATTSAAGLQSSADKTKLDGIETSATADQTGAEIKSAYEGEADTNAFTDADHTKLDGIETAATADQTASEIKTLLQSDKISTTEIADDAITNAKLNLISTSSVPSLEAKGDGSSQDGYIQLNCSQNSHGVKIKSPPHSANASYTLTLPNNDGDSGQFLKTDGSGSLSWDTVTGGGGVNQNLIVTLTESIDGSRTDFTMNTTPATAQNLMVSINGVIQKPNAGTTISNSSEGYCISGSTLKFATAPASGSTVFVVAQTAGSGGSTDLSFDDDAKIKLGNGDDLEIYHVGGAHSYIRNTANNLYVLSPTSVQIGSTEADTSAQEISGKFFRNGAVQLYYDNSEKFRTNGGGCQIFGNLFAQDNNKHFFGDGNDLEIYHDGTDSLITNSTGDLEIRGAGTGVGNVLLRPKTGENGVIVKPDNAVELYYDNSGPKLATTATGVNLGGGTCTFNDNGKLALGTGSDLQIYHDGNDSWIKDPGTRHFNFTAAQYQFLNVGANEFLIKAVADGTVELYYDHSKKFETASNGVVISGFTDARQDSTGAYSQTGAPGNLLARFWNGSAQDNSHAAIQLRASNDNAAADMWYMTCVSQTQNYNGALTFTARTASSSYQELVRFANNGEVTMLKLKLGSGNDHNGAKIVLQGAGNTDATNSVFVKNSDETELFSLRNDGVFYTGVDGASPYNLTTSSAANMVVSSTGAVRRSTSSVRYKKDIADATWGLADVLKLKPKTFKNNATGEFADDKTHAGFTAEDIHDLGLTEFVQYNEANEPDALAYGNMVALMAKAIQDLNAKVEALEGA